MNEEQKKQLKEKYTQAKQAGEKFFPDSIYKDSLVMIALFILLVGLAVFLGVANEPPADPNDSSYIPRPEWYFLFLFEMLKYFPGQIEWIGTTVLPGLAVLVLFLLPFIDRSPVRHWKGRKLGIGIMGAVVAGMVGLTIMAVASTPPVEEGAALFSLTDRIAAGSDLYGEHCTECHGADGDVEVIEGVEGLEGKVVSPISSKDVLYTFTDETFYNIIDQGQQDLGMPPFGLGGGGELQRGEIQAIVDYMRYTWDDRAELPADAAAAFALPTLKEGEIPSYEVHIVAITKRYCLSCHRPGKKNNEYLMRDFNEILTTGDNAGKNLVAGDLQNSILIRTLHREVVEGATGEVGEMPPSKPLPEELIKIFEAWVLAGMPNTAAEAAALQPTPPSTP